MIPRASRFYFFAAAVVVAATTGCRSGPYTPEGRPAGPNDPILFHTKEVNRVLGVNGVDVTPRGDGRLEVRVEFVNRTGKPIRVQVLTRFLDRARRLVGDETPYEHVALGPRSSTVHRVVSTARAEEFEMEVRRN